MGGGTLVGDRIDGGVREMRLRFDVPESGPADRGGDKSIWLGQAGGML